MENDRVNYNKDKIVCIPFNIVPIKKPQKAVLTFA